ncbi:MAG: ABC-type transport auxiliary lipoprotein family protein [Nitrococcus sp.]|nr:ABC-type transport auxiliary lipoprotein family protein [Nitrococcus sp.]
MPRLTLLATGLLLTACTGLLPPASQEPTHLYQLELRAPLTDIPSIPAEKRHGVVMVEQPQVAAGYDTTAMAYRFTPWEIHYYAQSRWVAAPARMLREALTRALSQAGPFRSALDQPSGMAVDYRLRTKLLRLEQDFSGAPPSRERLVAHVKLVDLQRGALLASRVLSFSVPAPSEDAHGGVVAANMAIKQLAAEVVELSRKALATHSKKRS